VKGEFRQVQIDHSDGVGLGEFWIVGVNGCSVRVSGRGLRGISGLLNSLDGSANLGVSGRWFPYVSWGRATELLWRVQLPPRKSIPVTKGHSQAQDEGAVRRMSF
jgi:hypothetical protein